MLMQTHKASCMLLAALGHEGMQQHGHWTPPGDTATTHTAKGSMT